MKKLLFSMLTMLCTVGTIIGQQSISGTVVDTDNEPLIGANIIVKGTGIGTITDIDGKYSLTVPENSDVVVFSYAGFSSIEIVLDGQSTVDATLSYDAIGLEDIVVIGYTPSKKKDITGAVSSVSAEDIANVQLPTLEAALQGRAAGVQVTKNSGKPGGGVDVNIRGRTSISASNQPLYVVDGIPIISGDNLDFSQEGIGNSNVSVISDINPDEIESIEVLKDAGSAAIYGSRAANGVVLITTKKGKKNTGTKVTLGTVYGTQVLPSQIDVVNGPQYIEYITEVFGANIVGTEANTNWQDEIFRSGAMREYRGSISGGDEKTSFFSSLGFTGEEGIVKNSDFDRFSGRLNLDHIVNDKLSVGMNMGYTKSSTRQVQNDNNIYGAVSAAILLPPVVPVFNDDGTYGSAFGLENPLAAVTEYDNQIKRGRMVGKVYANYSILEDLSLRASLGVDLVDQQESIYEPRVLQSSATGRAVEASIKNERLIHEYVLNYNKSIDNHSFLAIAGTSFQEDKINSTYSEATDFPTDDFQGISSGASPVTTNGGFSGDNLKSYFGSVNYNFDSKYYLTATMRADGSSRFVNNQWGYFPGISAAWNITEEDFMADSFFDLVKLRANWGQTGNNVIGNFSSRQLYGGGANYLDQPGIAPTQLGNPDLKWETTTSTNIGLDLGFMDNRVGVNVDFYVKNTTDLLLNRPIPTTSGFGNVLQNVGEMKNTGVDLTINTLNINRNDFTWETTFTVGYLKNEIVKLVDGNPIDAGFSNRLQEGESLGSFFGHQTVGIFQNQAEIEAAATQTTGTAPGDIQFADLGGGAGPDGILGTSDDLAPDGVINDDDRTFIGKALPDFMGGIGNRISYKGIEVNAFFQFATGHQIYNNNLAFAEGLNSVFAPTVNAWENRWQAEGDVTDIPRLVNGDPNNNRRDSDRFVEDADYIRLKTLTIGYNFPAEHLEGAGVSNLKVYFSGYNLWTATGYSWYDPEVNTFDGSNTALGTDFLSYPQPRQYTFGINVTF